jgi:hypothetical protein
MKTKFLSLAASIAALTVTAQAAVLVSETFDYTAGALAGQNGGTGFTGAWTINNSAANVTSDSFAGSVPTGYSLATASNSATLAPSGTASVGVNRAFTTAIDTNVASTYFVSYQFARFDANNTASGEQFRLQFRNGTTEQFGLGLSSTELIEVTNGTAFTGVTTAGSAFPIGSADFATAPKYLLVAKITLGAGPGADSVSASIFSSADSVSVEPTSWQITRTGSITASTLTGITFSASANTTASAGNIAVDNLYLGETFADVTSAIPEPSSFAALAGVALLGFAASRRRRAV